MARHLAKATTLGLRHPAIQVANTLTVCSSATEHADSYFECVTFPWRAHMWMSGLQAEEVSLTDGQASPPHPGCEPGSPALRGSPGGKCDCSVGESTVIWFRDVPLT